MNQSGVLRFRWPLLMMLAALLAWPIDRLAVDLLNPDSPPEMGLDQAALWIATWAPRLQLLTIFTVLLGAGTLVSLRRLRMAAICGVSAWLLTEVVVGILKRLVGRSRPVHPAAALEFIRPLYDRPDLKSFPSGHAATAVLFAIFICMATRSRVLRGLAFALVLVVMADRIYLGAHFLSDVLFGGAVGWAAVLFCQRLFGLYSLPISRSLGVRKLAGLAVLAWIVVATWLLNAPLHLVDARSGAEVLDWRVPGVAYPVLALEPFFGPALKLATLPDLRSFALRALIWLALGTGLAILALRRRALPWLMGLFVFMALWGAMALAGLPGRQGAPQPNSAHDFLVVDLQSHIGDPVDGGISLEDGLRRFETLGFDLVVPTWHNAWCQGRSLGGGEPELIDLWGAEWSNGAPYDSPLHLLVFNRSPQPEDLSAIRDWRELITAVHQAGGVVLASHFWRGDAEVMPGAIELAEAGIDGFEVAGRNQELRVEPRARLAEIRRLCRERGLVTTASGDFHGARSGNYCWNLLEAAGGEGADPVWAALTAKESRILPVALESPMAEDPGFLLPALVAWSYFRELGLAARFSWLLWLAGLVLGLKLASRLKKA